MANFGQGCKQKKNVFSVFNLFNDTVLITVLFIETTRLYTGSVHIQCIEGNAVYIVITLEDCPMENTKTIVQFYNV